MSESGNIRMGDHRGNNPPISSTSPDSGSSPNISWLPENHELADGQALPEFADAFRSSSLYQESQTIKVDPEIVIDSSGKPVEDRWVGDDGITRREVKVKYVIKVGDDEVRTIFKMVPTDVQVDASNPDDSLSKAASYRAVRTYMRIQAFDFEKVLGMHGADRNSLRITRVSAQALENTPSSGDAGEAAEIKFTAKFYGPGGQVYTPSQQMTFKAFNQTMDGMDEILGTIKSGQLKATREQPSPAPAAGGAAAGSRRPAAAGALSFTTGTQTRFPNQVPTITLTDERDLQTPGAYLNDSAVEAYVQGIQSDLEADHPVRVTLAARWDADNSEVKVNSRESAGNTGTTPLDLTPITQQRADGKKAELLIPFNTGGHWVTIRIQRTDAGATITCYNSLSSCGRAAATQAMNAIRDRLATTLNDATITVKHAENVPQQGRADCGVHTCMHIESILRNGQSVTDQHSMTQSLIDGYRTHMLKRHRVSETTSSGTTQRDALTTPSDNKELKKAMWKEILANRPKELANRVRDEKEAALDALANGDELPAWLVAGPSPAALLEDIQRRKTEIDKLLKDRGAATKNAIGQLTAVINDYQILRFIREAKDHNLTNLVIGGNLTEQPTINNEQVCLYRDSSSNGEFHKEFLVIKKSGDNQYNIRRLAYTGTLDNPNQFTINDARNNTTQTGRLEDILRSF